MIDYMSYDTAARSQIGHKTMYHVQIIYFFMTEWIFTDIFVHFCKYFLLFFHRLLILLLQVPIMAQSYAEKTPRAECSARGV